MKALRNAWRNRRAVAALAPLLGVAVLAAALLGAPAVQAGNAALKVRVGAHADFTRFVIELREASSYRLLTLNNPYRIVIDLPVLEWSASGSAAQGAGGGLVEKYRFGQFQPGVSRFVLDLTGPARVKAHFRLGPEPGAGHRVVVDLAPSDARRFAQALGTIESGDWPTQAAAAPVVRGPAPVRPPDRVPQDAKNTLRTVVIDPGHGGVDPGAIGSSGVYEKSVVLAFARTLREQLQRTGRYRVVLTRDSDLYIPLRRRYEVAHDNAADLFISVHADSHRSSKLKGMSVYTLSEKASDKEAAALAAKENKSDILAGYDLSDYDDQTSFILLDLAQRKTSEASWQFAQSVVSNMDKSIQLLRRPHRFAGFAVLKSPTVPSVLVELGYLSNREEERHLRTADYRSKLASGLVRAVDSYFSQQERLSRS